MKSYDRETGKYLTEEERKSKLKKRELCKGGRQHDWVRVLPWQVEALPNYKGDVEMYYAAEKKIEDFAALVYRDLAEQHGILYKQGKTWRALRENTRSEICSVCKKQRYVNLE